MDAGAGRGILVTRIRAAARTRAAITLESYQIVIYTNNQPSPPFVTGRWNSMRMSVSTEGEWRPDDSRLLHFRGNVNLVRRIQRMLIRRLRS